MASAKWHSVVNQPLQQRTEQLPHRGFPHTTSPTSKFTHQFASSPLSKLRRLSSSASNPQLRSAAMYEDSLHSSDSSSDSEGPPTPSTDLQTDDGLDLTRSHSHVEFDVTKTAHGGASTKVLASDLKDHSGVTDRHHSGTQLIEKYCCGGGCCFLKEQPPTTPASPFTAVKQPDNDAFRSLNLRLDSLSTETIFTNITALPEEIVTITSASQHPARSDIDTHTIPPQFVQPHPPYHVFAAPIFHARELTKPGAEKRTFHFDIDVTDYPAEGDVDFKVGGAVGICPPNSTAAVDEIFDLLGTPKFLRDKPITLKTSGGRWPTIWGEEEARELTATRRELLTWCSDIQSYPPNKALLRILAEHATAENERRILTYLVSAQGQGSFCDLRTGPHLSLQQLLHAFPSSRPPLSALFSALPQLMPRFYSLSNDPHVSSDREGLAGRRLIEIAVTIHETADWKNGSRTGVGSGFLERIAKQFIEAEERGEKADLHVPLFRGLMANPLSKEFGVSNGPMMLIGAGVGMAPFRGFILNRMRNANCASKIWLVQGVRDSSVDELYSGELGKYEAQIKKVVQSRKFRRLSTQHKSASDVDLPRLVEGRKLSSLNDDAAVEEDQSTDQEAQSQWAIAHAKTNQESRYVQDEVRLQGSVLWDIINATDGRVFVCGSTKGMGEGVEQALLDVAMNKGDMTREAAESFWGEMKSVGKYIAETW